MMYSIVRIIGNELPPRDKEGNRVKSLQFVLGHEPEFENCSKLWILNTIHNQQLKKDLIHKINCHKHKYYDFPFDRMSYLRANSRDDKIRWAININAARNYGLKVSQSRFTFLLDGDCFFTQNLWSQTIREMEEDGFSRQYYGVPGVRIVERIPDNYHEMRLWEPSLVFRDDAKMTFNEEVPFSKNDRIELMRKIGYQCAKGRADLYGDMCRNVGKLLHISFGEEELEIDMIKRMNAREKSIDRLLNHINHMILI